MRVIAKNRIAPAILSIITVLALAGCATKTKPAKPAAADETAAPWRAGVAEVDITPPVGYRMAGYFDERLSTGVHDPLQAKAIVLQQGGRKIALAFCDLVGFSLDVSRKACAAASRATGIPVTNIMIAATHSHTGPLFGDVRRDYFHKEAIAKYGKDPHEEIDYPPFLVGKVTRAIVEAAANLQPAELEAGITTRPGLAFNRRYYMKNGTVVFNPGLLNPNIIKPAGPTDPDVGILLIKNPLRAEPVGGLTVFAMHADTTSGTKFSADYPYFIQETLRGVFGSNYVSAFGAGACGDINHIDVSKKGRVSGFDVSQRLGDSIGQAVLAEVPHLTELDHPDLGVRSKTLMLPLQTVTPRELQEAKMVMPRMRDPSMNFYSKVRATKALDLARLGPTLPAEVQVFRLDKDTAIVCLPAEIFVEFGLAIKKASPFKQTFVITLCNQRPAYVPTVKAFSEGSYEVINSRWKPGAGDAMVQAAIQMLNELKSGL